MVWLIQSKVYIVQLAPEKILRIFVIMAICVLLTMLS